MQRPRLNSKRNQNTNSNTATLVTTSGEGVPTTRQLVSELLVIFGIIIVAITAFLWWHYVASNPKRVFTGMLNNTLQLPSASMHITQDSDGQTLDQRIDLQTSGQHVAHAFTTLTQADSKATTETIGTPREDYVRYTSIQTTQKTATGKPLDFSPVLNVWGKTNNTGSNDTTGQLYNQVALGVIPFGDLNITQRKQLLKLMQDTYSVDYGVVKHTTDHGRPIYTYRVQVMPQPYVVMLKQFASDSGLTQLEQLDPSQYAGSAPLTFEISVDVWSRQLKTITYTNNSRVEEYSQLGQVRTPLALPAKTVSVDELQTRLQTIQ